MSLVAALLLMTLPMRADVAKRGDVNADSEVNIADVNTLISIILGQSTPDETEAARADVNSDGEINIADVNQVISIILNGDEEEPAWVGGDMSMLSKYEAHQLLAQTKYNVSKAHYYDVNGNVIDDVIPWVKSQGWNAVRVRLFVNPANASSSDVGEGVIQNLDTVVALGKRIKAAGMRFVLDFHYSDSWADPVKQYTPADWASLDSAALEQQIYDYTAECLRTLRAAGAVPDAIQTGNEISYGMLWGPVGTSTSALKKCWSGTETNWARFTNLLKRAGEACRAVCPYAKIILHTERLAKPSIMLNFYNQMKAYGVDYDIIGLSYYPYYHGALSVLETGLTVCERNYTDKEVMIVETGYCYKYAISGDYDLSGTWPITSAGQQAFTKDLVAKLKEHECVKGVFWWFPEANEYGFDANWNALHVTTGWYNANLWDHTTGKAMPALTELSAFATE